MKEADEWLHGGTPPTRGPRPVSTAQARDAYVERVIVDVLRDNFVRISRYPDAEMAQPAIENVARELRKRLDEGLLR